MSALAPVIDYLLESLKNRKDRSHRFRTRFFAGWWGSFVLHFATVVTATGHQLSPPRVVEPVFYLLPVILSIYSAVFALVVAVGVPKGSLVRHFSYGVILPVFAYTMAGTVLTIGG